MRLCNGWTGGQYSVLRAALGLYLAGHLALAWSGSPALERLPVAAGIGLALLLALGAWDRAAALAVAALQAYLMRRDPAAPVIVGVLLLHAFLPQAPYGSWQARGRPGPRGGWSFPSRLFLAAWVVLSLAYAYDGGSELLDPSRSRVLGLELLFAPLALLTRARPWLWLAMLVLQLTLVVLGIESDFAGSILLLHGLAFDPAWLGGSHPGTTDRVFYDGSCGLCHRAVRFFLAEDRSGNAFRYAPLESDAALQALGAAALRALPDSIVIATANGEVLTRSAAMLHAGERLGGLWWLLAKLARCVPRPLRDAVYDWIARNRRRFFPRPESACPILPPELRARFDL